MTINKRFLSIFSVFIIIALMLASVPATPAAAATGPICYVDADATAGGNTGNSWADAYTDLQSALTDTNCTEIWVAAGTYTPGAVSADTFQLVSGVEVYGGFAGTESTRAERDPAANLTVLSGDIDNNDSQTPVITDLTTVTGNTSNSYHVVTGADGATLDGFTVTAGYANAVGHKFGGGMLNENSSPTVTNTTFSGNYADNGAGMYNDNSSPTVTNTTFSGNTAEDGGGMYNKNGSSPTVTNTTFSGNDALSGGGMYNWSSSPTVTNTTFSGNTANNGGGGGMSNIESSNPTVTNTTFSGNYADYDGGGMRNYESSPILTNVIIANSTSGGDCANFSSTLNAASANNLIEDATYDCGLTNGDANGNIVGFDPLLGALADNGGATQTFALLSGSPAIDTGDDTVCADAGTVNNLDQRGVTRPQGAGCDIGAYEEGTSELDVQRPASTSIADGGSDALGNQLVGTVNLSYTIDNSAGAAQLGVTAVTATNLTNSSGFSVDTSLPLNVPAGDTATLNISFNVDAAGAFSLDLDIANNDSDENPYDIAISGTAGADNDFFGSPKEISTGNQYKQDTSTKTSASTDPDLSSCGVTANTGKGLGTVWYTYTATANTAISLDTFGSDYDTFIAVWVDGASGLDLVACNDNSAGSTIGESQLAIRVQTGTTYYIEVGHP